jgi:hypothetical protein
MGKVSDLAEFVQQISQLELAKHRTRFFRGHHDYKGHKLEPGIYRKLKEPIDPLRLVKQESDFINEAVVRCPSDFQDTPTFFEKLVKLQHYGLPTRLLDVTTNALVALFFACEGVESKPGEVIVFDIPQYEVKYYNSDTVSVISNIARRPFPFNLRKFPLTPEAFNEAYKNDALPNDFGKFLHDIREDKPAFRPLIKREDLGRVIAVKARLNNARIARQDGAFLLFGMGTRKELCANIPPDWIVRGNDFKRIIIRNKKQIRNQLEFCGISSQALFPELDRQTRYIKDRMTAP